MRTNFLVEIPVHAARGKKISQKASSCHKERHAGTSLRRFQSLRDGPGNAAPALGFHLQLLQSRLGQAIVFRAAVIFGISPKGRNPAFVFDAVQGGEERAGFNVESATGELLDTARDAESM